MNRAELDATYPRHPAPKPPDGGWRYRGKEQRALVDYLLGHFARAALGLPTDELDVGSARSGVLAAYHEAFMTFGYGAGGSTQDSERGKATCALLAAALTDYEAVATCSGGKTLGTKVQPGKIYFTAHRGHDLRGLGRHLATAARARLPAGHVEAAMRPLREDFVAGKLADPRVALVAAYAWFAHVAVAPDLAAATSAWLAGEPLGLDTRPVQPAVADGDDPRARIFEQFAFELANDDAAARHHESLVDPEPHSFDLRVFQPDRASDAAVYLYVSRRELPEGWARRVDPHVARWLGAKVTPKQLATRRADMLAKNRELEDKRKVRAYVVRDMCVDVAIRALHLGDSGVLCALTGGGELAAWKPGKLFKDDWRKLVRYLGAAAAASDQPSVTPAGVEPAWFDFLARPNPKHITWSNLLALQAVITETIGGEQPATVGRALQLVLTGI